MDSKVNINIKNKVAKMLESGNHDIYMYDIVGQDVIVEDISVIIAYYGIDQARLDATKKAFSLFKKYKAKPIEVVVVESQFYEDDIQLKSIAEEAGFKHMFIKRNLDSDGLFIKEALYNIAVRSTRTPKIIALDSDVGFCNPYWIQTVSTLLDECDMTQPFGYVYFTKNGKFDPQRLGLEQSMARMYSKHSNKKMLNNVGLGFAFKRWIFDSIGGFDVISSPSDDMWMWHKIFSIDRLSIPLLPYSPSVDGCLNMQCTKAVIKSCLETCFHIEHNNIQSRRYAAYLYACTRQSMYPLWDVDYDVTSNKMPKWHKDDEPWITLRKDTIRRIQQLGNEEVEDATSAKKSSKKVIEQANFNMFGKISSNRRLKVITHLTNANVLDDVLLHQSLVKKSFGNSIDYICISDKQIPGVHTIAPTIKNKMLCILDMFKKEIAGNNDICLYMSLGAIPLEQIEICNIPNEFIGMSNPRYSSSTAGLWRLYNSDIILFSGNFNFIYNDFVKNDKFVQSKMFINPCQCISYNLYSHDVLIRNICQFIDVQYIYQEINGTYAQYVDNLKEKAENDKYCTASIAIGSTFGASQFRSKNVNI